ncbi:MAG: hypothetical protein Q4E82_05415 [Peptococcaceae bacterium]|jgi:hypothetical protein|nr:hypothetical protein [Peptococcaceae bacterium]
MKIPYSDMLTLPHPSHPHHPPMPRPQRAAQFAAFAALTGFEDKLAHMERHVTDHYNDPYR